LNSPLRTDPAAQAYAEQISLSLSELEDIDATMADRVGELVAHLARIREARRGEARRARA